MAAVDAVLVHGNLRHGDNAVPRITGGSAKNGGREDGDQDFGVHGFLIWKNCGHPRGARVPAGRGRAPKPHGFPRLPIHRAVARFSAPARMALVDNRIRTGTDTSLLTPADLQNRSGMPVEAAGVGVGSYLAFAVPSIQFSLPEF